MKGAKNFAQKRNKGKKSNTDTNKSSKPKSPNKASKIEAEVKFFAIPNLSSTKVFELEKPWEAVSRFPYPQDIKDKNKFRKFCVNLATEHAFISGFEGLVPHLRCSYENDNPPYKIHAIIIDYDAPLSANILQYLQKHLNTEYPPQWLVQTFSGYARLVWLFERPLPLFSKKHIKNFLVYASRKIGFKKFLPGYEAEALLDITKYYEIGKKWTPLKSEAFIPAEIAELWLFKASEKLDLDEQKYDIPFDAIAAEVEKRFPGRWSGPFEEGARGVRFWDPTADNETAAVVHKDGMLCFTGPQPFVSWREIFGNRFVEQYEASRFQELLSRTAYDGRQFWLLQEETNQWVDFSKEDFSQYLRILGFNPRKAKGQTHSEVDQVEWQVKLQRRVKRALPFVHFPTGIIVYRGEKYLNTATAKCMEPARLPEGAKLTFEKGKDYFPFLYGFLITLFESTLEEGEKIPPLSELYKALTITTSAEDIARLLKWIERKQLLYLLAWLKYFYENAWERNPKPGQTLVLAGPVGKGKTLFSRLIVGSLMGGYADASGHLVEGEQWTDRLAENPIMAVDDSLAVSDMKMLTQFSSRLKKYVANASMVFNQKYRQTGEVPWFGRIIVTCNLDAESLRILPNMDISIKDKVSLFKTSDRKVQFPPWQKIQSLVLAELPFLARFLLDWEYPKETIAPEARFGIRSFHHPELFEESLQQGSSGIVLELLVQLMDLYRSDNQYKNQAYWLGTATQLYEELSRLSPTVFKGITTRSLATALGVLAKNGFNISKQRDTRSRLYKWKIGFDLFGGQ